MEDSLSNKVTGCPREQYNRGYCVLNFYECPSFKKKNKVAFLARWENMINLEINFKFELGQTSKLYFIKKKINQNVLTNILVLTIRSPYL